MVGSISKILSLPGARQLRQSAALNRILRTGYGPWWGNFGSRSDAENYLNKSKRVTYNNPEIVAINLESFKKIHLFDWPVLYALQQMSNQGRLRSIVDFGGHVGAKFYAFREIIDFSPEFAWQVVDVPAVCAEGNRRLKPDDGNLSYSPTFENIVDCDVLLCSGSLQYCDEEIGDVVTKLPQRPKMIILNKIALSESAFYTLESFSGRRMPYRINTQENLDSSRCKINYKKFYGWTIPDMDFTVPHQDGSTVVQMIGEAWLDASDHAVVS